MKPEKINLTDKGYSIKSDIWSLGISLVSFFLVK
jgi:serine/threonine protein kinase